MSDPQPAGTPLSVAYPWAWSWCPASELPMSMSPDEEDGRTRTNVDTPDWWAVTQAVVSAVHQAQAGLTSSLLRWSEVVVPYRLDVASARVAQSWVSLGEGVEWSLSGEPHIINGRHRLWATHALPHTTTLPYASTR